MLILDDGRARRGTVARGLGFTAAMTLGFAAVFGVFGLLLSSVSGPILSRLPWFTVVLGLALAAVGLWLALGRTLPGPALPTGQLTPTRAFGSMMLFGGSYALASLGCTIGPFLVSVVATFRTGSILGGVAVFAAYALGMGLVVAGVSVSVVLARDTAWSALRRHGSLIGRIGGVLLALSGLYVGYYGWYELRVLRGSTTDDPVIAAGATVQRWLASGLERFGPIVAVMAALLILTLILLRRTRARRSSAGPDPKIGR